MDINTQIKGRLVEIENEMTQVQETADKTGGIFTPEQKEKLTALSGEHSELKSQLELREKLVAAKGATAVPVPATRPALTITGGSPWRTVGQYAMDVRKASYDPNTKQRLMNAASVFSNETTDGQGGYAVPDDLRRNINQKVFQSQESLLSKCDVYSSTAGYGNLTFPRDTEQDWQLTSISGARVAEGADYAQSDVTLGTISVSSAKVGVVINATNELIRHADAFDRYIQNKGARKMNYLVNSYIMSGSGANNIPTGYLAHAACKVVLTGTENATDDLSGNNVQQMYYGMHQSQRANAVWIVSDSVEEKLPNLKLSGSTLYARPGDFLNASNTGLLLGRPVIVSPHAKAIGDTGDISFVDLSQYLAVTEGGVGSDFTPYLYWLSDTLSWKFYIHLGGRPWIDAPVTMGDGSTTRSPFVRLQGGR